MPLLAKPLQIDKGSTASLTLDKNGLASLPIVDADNYFRDVNNWKEVNLVYKTPFGGIEQVVFDAAALFPVSDFAVSARARGGFVLESLIIRDFDNGYLLIPAGDLGVSDFELTFAPQSLPTLDAWVAMSKIFSLSEDYVAS